MIIDDIVNSYIHAIKITVLNCKEKLKNMCIYNVFPPIQKYNTSENPEYPILVVMKKEKPWITFS